MEGARSGQWTSEEVTFATRLIDEFRNGSLDIAEGTSMRGFLADKLGCVPKRISKKYENTNYNGRLQYVKDKTLSAEVCVRRRLELEKLERAFQESIQEGEASKEVTKKQEKPRKAKPPCKDKDVTQKEKRQEEKQYLQAQRQLHLQMQQEQRLRLKLQQQQQQQRQQQRQEYITAATGTRSVSSSDVTQPWQSRFTTTPANPAATQAGLLAVADLERSLKRNAEATTAANDELLSLLAARQRLAQQSLSLHHATLGQEPLQPPSIDNTLAASAARANQIFNTLSSLKQQPPTTTTKQIPHLSQPLTSAASAQNTAASKVERLRFLRQIELEQQQQQQQQQHRNLLFASTSSSTTTTSSLGAAALPATAGTAAPKWSSSQFHKQAKLLAVTRDAHKKPTPQPQPASAPGPLLSRDFLKAAAAAASRKRVQQQPAAAVLAARSIPKDLHDRTMMNNCDNNNSYKRKQAPTMLLPDPKRPRHH